MKTKFSYVSYLACGKYDFLPANIYTWTLYKEKPEDEGANEKAALPPSSGFYRVRHQFHPVYIKMP